MLAGRRSSVWFAFAAIAILTSQSAQAQQVLAVVNGIPITSYDVDQRSRLQQISTGKSAGRKEILEELIEDKIKLLEAKKYTIEASNAEVEGAFASMASRMAAAASSSGIAMKPSPGCESGCRRTRGYSSAERFARSIPRAGLC